MFFVLKRLSRAQADGDAIDAIIRNVTVSHNGATRTLTTPSVSAQQNLAQRALAAAGVRPDDVIYLECEYGLLSVTSLLIELVDSSWNWHYSWGPDRAGGGFESVCQG